MNLTVFEKGFNFSQDGPGNRLVLHLQGCNLFCPWCANPEGMPFQPPLMQLTKELPDWICPHGAISDGELNRTACANCKAHECVSELRNRYLCVRAETRPVSDWLSEILRSSPMFFSGGGVTLTGGEVCMQLDATIELLRQCREQGIHTAVETNLSLEKASRLFEHLDLLIADYKHYDRDKLQRVTGAELDVIERNIRRALEKGLPTQLRIPLVNSFNANDADIDGFAEAFQRISAWGRFSLELLSYHEFGVEKWAQCGMSYTMKDAHVRPDVARRLAKRLLDMGIHVIST